MMVSDPILVIGLDIVAFLLGIPVGLWLVRLDENGNYFGKHQGWKDNYTGQEKQVKSLQVTRRA